MFKFLGFKKKQVTKQYVTIIAFCGEKTAIAFCRKKKSMEEYVLKC